VRRNARPEIVREAKVGGFLQEPFAEWIRRSPASPGPWHDDRRPDGSLLLVLSSESQGSSSARNGELVDRDVEARGWSCVRNPV